MANFYSENKNIKFHLDHPLMKKIVELKEDNYKYAKQEILPEYDTYAPLNYEDALDSFDKVLEIVGQVCAEIIEPNAESVDAEGPKLENNRVSYASGTVENLKVLSEAGLMGMQLSREHGGLNFPATVYSMAVEMVSQGDASLMNLFGLQDIGVTIKEYASKGIQDKYLPRFSSGTSTGAMILTEPDAGSDLQAVNLKAAQDESGNWILNGVKRFITNGNAELSLVLARSEEGTHDGRGLSMFLYERDDTVQIRRIENKMGIHGSPTCEMVFKNSPCILIGKKRFGLIKYVMALMNGARLGIGCQSVGISQACYNESVKYAKERKQFGKVINTFPAVYEILGVMKAKLEASRALLYETSRFVDLYKVYEDIAQNRKLEPEEKLEMKKYHKKADLYTPLLKGLTSEYCNQIAYDAIQIHGGTGFMKDFPVERLYRDARITSIYEGTTQLQVVAIIGGVTNGFFTAQLEEYANEEISPEFDYLKKDLVVMTAEYNNIIEIVISKHEKEYLDYHARRLVEIVGNIVMGYLLVFAANKDKDGEFTALAEIFISRGKADNKQRIDFINNSTERELGLYKKFAF